MSNTTAPTKPADLSMYVLHTPAEVRQHRLDTEDYFKAIQDIERAKQAKAQAVINEANRTLNDDDYFALKLKQKKEQDDKQAQRVAAEKATELARIDFLMSSPPVVEIMETNEHRFLTSVINFASRGYTLGDNGILHFGHGLFHCNLDAPATTKKAGSK